MNEKFQKREKIVKKAWKFTVTFLILAMVLSLVLPFIPLDY